MSSAYNMVAVVGPTASGKTAFAAQLAYHTNGEVISADSRQVYRQMNLGTGKDYRDYLVNGQQVPFHLIDIAYPGYKYNVFEFQRDFIKVLRDIQSRGKLPVLCGGSGMYIDAAIRGYQLTEVPHNAILWQDLQAKTLQELEEILSGMKILHNKTDVNTMERAIRAIEIEYYYRANPELTTKMPTIKTLFMGIRFERTIECIRITDRLKMRLQQGMVEEVNQLLKSGISPDSLIYYGLEYKYITLYLIGKLEYSTMFTQLNTAIHQFAKRQRTWFRKMEREGTTIHWLNGSMPLENKLEITRKLMEHHR